jgi:anti-anti-sigma factor
VIIDTYSSNNAQKRLNRAIEKVFVRIIIDARGLSYVSSTGVGIFVHLMKTLKLCNGNVVLMHFQPTVWQVLELLGFTKWFTIAIMRSPILCSVVGQILPNTLRFPQLLLSPTSSCWRSSSSRPGALPGRGSGWTPRPST